MKKPLIITLQREKCIGCNYCVEQASAFFRMSKKDGKAVLLNSENKKEFYTHKSTHLELYEAAKKAQQACPVKIITVKLAGE